MSESLSFVQAKRRWRAMKFEHEKGDKTSLKVQKLERKTESPRVGSKVEGELNILSRPNKTFPNRKDRGY